jgi:heat shock protein HspQ
MKFKIGDHLQEIDTPYHGYVTDIGESSINKIIGFKIGFNFNDETWYLIENDELNLVNHWVPESNLELHKQPLREFKLEQLGIK